MRVPVVLVAICCWALLSTIFLATQLNVRFRQSHLRSSVTIFAPGTKLQEIAVVESWLKLVPSPCVVILGEEQTPSLIDFITTSKKRGACISVDNNMEFTFLGTPMFHSMVARARAAESQVSVLVASDILLRQDFMDVLQQVSGLENDWLLTAAATEHGNCSDIQIWAWNTGQVPLHFGVLPSFTYGAGYHNEWLLNEALMSNMRLVMDATHAFSLVRQPSSRDKYHRPWEAQGNAYLSATYGSYAFRPPGYSNPPAKLVRCGSELCLTRARDTGSGCILTRLSHISGGGGQYMTGKGSYITVAKRYLAKKQLDCIQQSLPICHTGTLPGTASIDFSYTFELESLLPQVATPDKVVILTVVGNNYRDLLMSWQCRLRHLNVSNFLVSAIDEDLYRFGILQGLPVFRAASLRNSSYPEDCSFGTDCFQRITKLKSRTVLQILELGYNVLFSDVDVYWFSNPVQILMNFGPGNLVAQTDSYQENEAPNVPRRLNSGFYFAWSDNSTITAFREIVAHASKSKASEQPSFYDVLCGKAGRNRKGKTMCVHPETNLTVHFLDRLRFPNGAYRLIWKTSDVKATCLEYGCVILHNNWKTGAQQKLERQMRTGLWEYNVQSRTCVREWQSRKR